jgi:small conductance mechanosensitive channel
MSLEQSTLLQLALKVGAALLVFLLGRWLAGRTHRTLGALLARTTLAPSVVRLLLLAAYYSILWITGILALALIGFPLTALLTASLIVVVIVGFAFRESISNLAATILFMLFQPFRLGELIETNGVMGEVTEIQLFNTVLVTGDNKEVTIPNGMIQDSTLSNYTRRGRLRVDFVFGVSYADDLDQVKQVLRDILAADPRVLAEPAAEVFVQTLADSSVNLAVRPWVTPDDYWSVQGEMPERVKLRFDAEGITMPFPQRDIHVHSREGVELSTNESAAKAKGLELLAEGAG